MKLNRPWANLSLPVFAAFLVSTGCSGDSRNNVAMTSDTLTADTSAMRTREESSGRPEQRSAADADDPFAAFDLDSPTIAEATIIKRVSVWIVNAAGEEGIVQAEAGAGAVTLDTLAAGDSIQIRLESRADSVMLRARSSYGVELGRVWIRTDGTGARAVFP